MVGVGKGKELIFPIGWDYCQASQSTERANYLSEDLTAIKCQALEPTRCFSDFENVAECLLLTPVYRAHHNQTRIQSQANHIPVLSVAPHVPAAQSLVCLEKWMRVLEEQLGLEDEREKGLKEQ